MMLDTLNVENDFLNASEKAKTIDFEDDQKLVLYGLYKQALIGNINCGKPSFLDIVGTAKWNAWKGFSGFPKKSAMGAYIYILLINGWKKWERVMV